MNVRVCLCLHYILIIVLLLDFLSSYWMVVCTLRDENKTILISPAKSRSYRKKRGVGGTGERD